MPADTTLKRAQTQLTGTEIIGEAARTLPFRDRIGDWIFPPKGVEQAPVSLSQRRVYILPYSYQRILQSCLRLKDNNVDPLL